MKIMKKTVIITLLVLCAAAGLSSCRQPNELPPLTDGYATKYILPDPEDLTAAERLSLQEMEEEYDNAIK